MLWRQTVQFHGVPLASCSSFTAINLPQQHARIFSYYIIDNSSCPRGEIKDASFKNMLVPVDCFFGHSVERRMTR
jgi:hypothetical protein